LIDVGDDMAVARLCLDGDIFYCDDNTSDLDVVRTNAAAVKYEVGGGRGFGRAKNLDTNFFAPFLPLNNLRRNMQKKNFRYRKIPKSPKFFLCV
jgi:hypothetical protein